MYKKIKQHLQNATPSALLFFTLSSLAIILGEVLKRYLIEKSDYLTELHHTYAVVDAAFLSIIAIPVLYLFLYRPLKLQLLKRKETELELLKINHNLDDIVKARTLELEKLNKLIQKEYVEELRLSEEKFKSVVDNLGLGISIIDRNMKVLSINRQLQIWFPDLELSKEITCFKSFAPGVRDTVCDNCPTVKTLQDGKIYEVTREANINGRRKIHRIISSPIKDKSGQIIAASEVVEDITGKIEANTNRYRALVKNSSEGIFVFEPYTLQIQEASVKFLDMLGYKEKEVTKLNYLDIVIAAEENIRTSVNRILDSGEVSHVQRQYRKKDGSIVDVEVNSALVTYGETKVCLTNVRDLTEDRRKEFALRQSFVRLENTLRETVNALMAVSEKRDPYTAGHQQRVAGLACVIARELGLSAKQIEGLKIAGILHDIGKIYVPADILNKPGRLSEMEMGIIKGHPQIGYEILEKIPFESPVAEIVLQHHERLDGSGYPKGLRDHEIVLEAKILAVADVVEAMASHRPYRPAIGLKDALEEISINKGVTYDTNVVNACLKLFLEKGYDFDETSKNIS